MIDLLRVTDLLTDFVKLFGPKFSDLGGALPWGAMDGKDLGIKGLSKGSKGPCVFAQTDPIQPI